MVRNIKMLSSGYRNHKYLDPLLLGIFMHLYRIVQVV